MSLHLDILASGDARLILGPGLRAETTVDQAEHAHARHQADLAEAEDTILRAIGGGFTPGDIEHLIDVVTATSPALALGRWIDSEQRPDMRRRLACMLAVVGEE